MILSTAGLVYGPAMSGLLSPSRFFRTRRAVIVLAHDVVMAGIAFMLTLTLRVGGAITSYDGTWLTAHAVAFMSAAGLTFLVMGLYRGVWRYASTPELLTILRATSVAVLIFTLAVFAVTRLADMPRSLPVILWFVTISLLGGPRFLYRLLREGRQGRKARQAGGQRIPVLLAGAGDRAELFLRDLNQTSDAAYRVVGLLDDKGGRVGRDILGVPVRGRLDDLAGVLATLRQTGDAPHRLILTTDRLPAPAVQRLFDEAQRLALPMARLPRLTDFHHDNGEGRDSGSGNGAHPVARLRPIAIEDLLGRAQTALDRTPVERMVHQRRVLVTGAGGSIGAELAHQIAAYGPATLTLADLSEYALYAIDLDIAMAAPDVTRCARLVDVRDGAALDRLLAQARPDLVFHAAALKHVPMVEAQPLEGIRTNTLGTAALADACRRAGVGCMVLISTDKAVNPKSVMGATKRAAERYCQALDLARVGSDAGPNTNRNSPATRFVTVRFGNVLGSTGSVVPLFRRQIAGGGPVTVTHPDMRRYFMTVREAVELILQASAAASPAQAGAIHVLDMGQPVAILDLARRMIRLAGLEPEHDIAITFTGLRPGEKLDEELFHDGEPPTPTSLPGILQARPRSGDVTEIATALNALTAAVEHSDTAAALAGLARLVPEFTGGPAIADSTADVTTDSAKVVPLRGQPS